MSDDDMTDEDRDASDRAANATVFLPVPGAHPARVLIPALDLLEFCDEAPLHILRQSSAQATDDSALGFTWSIFDGGTVIFSIESRTLPFTASVHADEAQVEKMAIALLRSIDEARAIRAAAGITAKK